MGRNTGGRHTVRGTGRGSGYGRVSARARAVVPAFVVGAVTVLLTVLGSPASAVPAPGQPIPLLSSGLAVDRAATTRVAPVTGRGGLSDTAGRFGVEGTDLGHMIAHKGRVAVVFGDTYGAPAANPFFSVKHTDWRSNVMGWMDPALGPAGGVRLDQMITDRPGHAKELLVSQHRRGVEETVIPTGGLSVGGRMFLQYMSVKEFDQPGHWQLNSAGIARSDDDGQNWVKEPQATFPGSSPFGQVAYADPDETPDGAQPGDTVYVYGIPGGRYGPMSLAKVAAGSLDRPAAYQYWTGSAWSSDVRAAHPIVPGPVGEMSVRYNPYYHKWLMMYLVDPTGEIVLRSADSPTGPWSDPQVVLTTKDYPEAYAPYLTPSWNAGPQVWFTMSQYGTYRVSLMRTQLNPFTAGLPLPLDLRATPFTGQLLGPRPQHPFERVP